MPNQNEKNISMLSENIKNYRIFRGMSQSNLAALLGKSKNTISTWERGDNMPNPDDVERICQILNITPNQIFGWETVPEFQAYIKKQRERMQRIEALQEIQKKLQKELSDLSIEIAEERSKLQEDE